MNKISKPTIHIKSLPEKPIGDKQSRSMIFTINAIIAYVFPVFIPFLFSPNKYLRIFLVAKINNMRLIQKGIKQNSIIVIPNTSQLLSPKFAKVHKRIKKSIDSISINEKIIISNFENLYIFSSYCLLYCSFCEFLQYIHIPSVNSFSSHSFLHFLHLGIVYFSLSLLYRSIKYDYIII